MGHDAAFLSRVGPALCLILASAAMVLSLGCPGNQQTIATGTIHVDAMLDGSPWKGPVSYAVTGQASGTAVPATYTNIPAGSYAFNYLSGGPSVASFFGTIPAGTQTVTDGGTITFTLDFRTREVARSNVLIRATVRQDDNSIVSWLGSVSFTLIGSETISGASVPHPFNGMPVGEYTLDYVSGGPPDATFLNITPLPTQVLTAGDTITFTMEFG